MVEVADRVGSSIFQLKQIRDEVKTVPQTVTRLINETDMLNPLLSELEANMSLSQSSSVIYDVPSAKRGVEFCWHALDEMAAITEDLTARINLTKRARRSSAKVKVILKKEMFLNFKDRLRRVVSTLGLAQQHYML